MIREGISTGAALGFSREDAVRRGLSEVIERDAFMLSFLSDVNIKKVYADSGLPQIITHYFKRYNFQIHMFDISTDVNIPTIMGIIIDETGIGPAVSVGAKTHDSVDEAYVGALLEAHQIRAWQRQTPPPIIPTDPKMLTTVESRCRYWFPVERIADLNFWLNIREETPLSVIRKSYSGGEKSSGFIRNSSELGFDILVADLTPRSVRDVGASIVKVVVPQMHPLYLNERFPYLYSNRLSKYGLRTETPNPHPFT